MTESEEKIELLEEDYRLLRDLIYEYSGLYFDDQSKFLFEKRLVNSIRRRQLKDFREYYYFLKYDPKREEEMANVIDVLATHETYFFREMPQLQTLSEEILPEIKKRKESEGRKILRIWSAGCSTGEEPYTISILLLESKLFDEWKVEVFGSDISQRVLQTARKGAYQKSAFRSTDPYYINKYFDHDGTGYGYKISDKVKEKVIFGCLNLIDRDKTALINSLDIILCRNVLIYFDRNARKRVIDTFHNKLEDKGFLLLGHSESLINLSNAFALRHFKHDMVYQKVPGQKNEEAVVERKSIQNRISIAR